MKATRRRHPRDRASSALLITLLILSLITIIATAFLGTMSWAIAAARRGYENQKAQAFAMLGMNSAVAQLRSGLDPWDNPYANFATNPPAFYWSVSPGLLTRWSYTSTAPLTNYPLFSIGSTNLVNLNAAKSDGAYPIAGITSTTVAGGAPPNISVYWVNVLKNPATTTASSGNPLVGRYAFWIDDENAKININTADGTMKYQTNSLGVGSPSEVSLQALQQNGGALPVTTATNIVYLARTTGLNSPKEILRAAGTTPDLYSNNVFNLTAYSRSPDLNVFGQPKMALTPILGNQAKYTSDMTMDSMTLQPARALYPTPSQLPKYSYIAPQNRVGGIWSWHPGTPNTIVTSQPYPLAIRGSSAAWNTGVAQPLDPGDQSQIDTTANYPWINGLLLANYLAGTNAASKPVNWPALPGSSTSGFAGKYTARQIDSIVAQILSVGSKTISPDIPYASGQDTYANALSQGGRGTTLTTPFLFSGWLSNEWVSGMGRSPKVSSIELEFVTKGPPVGVLPADIQNYYPSFNMDIWVEWWLPAAYLGSRNDIAISSAAGQLCLGMRNETRVLNMTDLSQLNNANPYPGAALPKSDGTVSWWGNQLLTSNQGIDFQANPIRNGSGVTANDPDQASAAAYHTPFGLEADNVTYHGSGQQPGGGILQLTPFSMTLPQANGPASDWQAGALRCIRSRCGPTVLAKGLPMQLSALGSTLTISGGIQIPNCTYEDAFPSYADPVPLESIRGTANPAGVNNTSWIMSNELWTDPACPANPAMPLRTRFLSEVIPIQASLPVPAAASGPTQNTAYVLIKVADPLVNKFPGDWTSAGGATVTVTTAPPTTTPPYWATAGTTDATVATANEFGGASNTGSGTFHNALADPDSYWLPQADAPICYTSDLAAETIVPRSARCPNIGYLQYVRTGIMPDTPSPADPIVEHGTPFRLLSYAPISDAIHQKTTASGSQAYPDWAMLDLFYIPSTLAPFGSPYGYYDVSGVWQGFGNPTVLANNGTSGGSTAGRLNPNGVVIYTTNSVVPQPGIARTVPLQALVHGLKVNQSLNSSATSLNPAFTGGTVVNDSISESDANSIPVAIESYIRANGPIRLPGELCNVPAVAALRAPANPTRNDLIRQIIGNITTQSNTFSVWVAGESISKSKSNTANLGPTDSQWGLYQPGDQILSSARYHFVVERYLDPGADGVYGNSVSAGTDGVNGTYDDPVDPINHPFQPRYLYRVVAAEEIR